MSEERNEPVVVLTIEDLDSYSFGAIQSQAEEWFAPYTVRCSDPTDVRRLDATGLTVSLSAVELLVQCVALWVAMRRENKGAGEVEEELEAARGESDVSVKVEGDGSRLEVCNRDYVIRAEVGRGVILVMGNIAEEDA